MNNLDKDYQALLQDILDNGAPKSDRTGTGTISVFGRQIRHKMSEGFPLLTTKKMPFKTIVTELLWFLRGDTNIKYLVDNNCHIWDGDAYKSYENKYYKGEAFGYKKLNDLEYSPDLKLSQEEFINKIKTDDEFAKKWGELGPIYGKQWRKWKFTDKFTNGEQIAYVNGNVDQIQNLINDLKTNPDSRRLMVNAWNVGEIDQMVIPPCHYGFQVYTRELSHLERYKVYNKTYQDRCTADCYTKEDFDNKEIPTRAISLMFNMRSCDTFLGLPFNIASYGLLLEIIAKEVNMVPDELIGNLGDVHLYSNHIEQAKEQIGREYTLEERMNIASTDIHFDPADFGIGDGISTESMHETCDLYGAPRRTRQPFPLPTLKFKPCPITGISMEYQSIGQFEIENYQSHPTIKAPLSN